MAAQRRIFTPVESVRGCVADFSGPSPLNRLPSGAPGPGRHESKTSLRPLAVVGSWAPLAVPVAPGAFSRHLRGGRPAGRRLAAGRPRGAGNGAEPGGGDPDNLRPRGKRGIAKHLFYLLL